MMVKIRDHRGMEHETSLQGIWLMGMFGVRGWFEKAKAAGLKASSTPENGWFGVIRRVNR